MLRFSKYTFPEKVPNCLCSVHTNQCEMTCEAWSLLYSQPAKNDTAFFTGPTATASSQGGTAITQAIDHQDIDALRILFEKYSESACTRLQTPGNENCHTCPQHFAIQVGWSRDSEECIGIVESILDFDLPQSGG